MTPRHKKRLMTVLFVAGGGLAAAALTAAAFRENILFFYTPSQLEQADLSRPFRLGGVVESITRREGELTVRFVVSDTANRVTVSYTGVLPDLFREKQGVVVRGMWDNDILLADEVLAKHDENYAPPEVQDALQAAQTLDY